MLQRFHNVRRFVVPVLLVCWEWKFFLTSIGNDVATLKSGVAARFDKVVPTLWQCHKVVSFQSVLQRLYNIVSTSFQLIEIPWKAVFVRQQILINVQIIQKVEALHLLHAGLTKTFLHKTLICISYQPLFIFIQLCSHCTNYFRCNCKTKHLGIIRITIYQPINVLVVCISRCYHVSYVGSI